MDIFLVAAVVKSVLCWIFLPSWLLGASDFTSCELLLPVCSQLQAWQLPPGHHEPDLFSRLQRLRLGIRLMTKKHFCRRQMADGRRQTFKGEITYVCLFYLLNEMYRRISSHRTSCNSMKHETGSQQTDFTKGHNNKLFSDLCTHLTDQCTFSAPTGTVGADMVGVSARKASQKVTDCEYTHSVTTGNQLSFTVTLKHQTIGSQKGRIKHWHVS